MSGVGASRLLATTPITTVMGTAALTIAAVMFVTWIASVVVRDASIVDPVWPFGFVAVASAVLFRAEGDTVRRAVLVTMVAIWGLRLCAHLVWRRRGGHGEDFRYRAMRRHWGARFPIVSLVTVFALQGALMWIVALPVQLGLRGNEPTPPAFLAVGIAAWLVGFGFEAIGDAQLTPFRADPTSSGRVLDTGLWRYTRHPNYFGDACVWWGIALVALGAPAGVVGLIGAIVMSVLLRRVSGVTLLERALVKRRPGYADYVQRTSAFVPRPPKRPGHGAKG
jgi:steroid 5-alpha reductase family enzyme